MGRSGKLSRVALGRGVARARWSLCDGTVLCRLLNTGTAEWAPDEAEEKKYKYCGSVVIGGCPRPSPSFFSLCKHCKDTCAVDWLVARPRGGPHEFRQGARSGVATRGGLAWQLEFRLARGAAPCQDTHPAWRTPARNADHVETVVAKAKRGGPRRGGLSGAQRPTARARPSRPGRATALAARDCVTGGGAEPAGPRSGLPTQIQNLDVQEWIIAEIHRKRLLKVKTNKISGTFLYGWNASTKFDKFERVEPA